MSEEVGELNKKVFQASGIVAAAEGKVKIVDAMKLVGFSTPERKTMRIYQQVRRKAQRVTIVEKKNNSIGLHVLAIAATACDISSLTDSGSIATPVEENGTHSAPVAPSESTKDSSKKVVSKVKVSRKTSRELQRCNAIIARASGRDKEALKQATKIIDVNRKLPLGHPDRKSHDMIVKEVNTRLDSNINVKTAGRYVLKGLIGVSPLKKGPMGDIPSRMYNALQGAFITYLMLEQAESKKQSNMKQMSNLVNATVNKGGFDKVRDDLVRKLRKGTAHLFEVGQANIMEQRRLMWTTEYNLDTWFSTWKETLVELGFAREKTEAEKDTVEGELYFFPGQKHRIGNIDETDGSLDDTSHQRGGRPAVTFYSPDISGGGTAVNKSGYSSTIICGSNAAGDPFPPHFQLKTMAQTEEGQRLSVDWFTHAKDVIGTFGFPVRVTLPCTFGMNERGGMNSVELAKYMKSAVLPLYPDMEDKPGKRIIMKLDSGPGRMNVEMLAELRLLGCYVVPGVPNTTSKTQETDQNYGPMKSCYRKNLRYLSQERFQKGLSLHVTDLPLLLFGGICPKTNVELQDAFSVAFSVDRNLACWKVCGAVPLTRSPLTGTGVRREVPIGEAAAIESVNLNVEDDQIVRLRQLEVLNNFHCNYLTLNGYDGSKLLKKAPTRTRYVAVTKPQSNERIQAIKRAKTAGQMFYATGGKHVNTNEFFKAKKLLSNDALIKALEAKKKARAKTIIEQKEAVMMIRQKGDLTSINHKDFTLTEVKALLKWKKVKSKSTKKKELIEEYIKASKPSKPTKVWSRSE